MYEDNFTPSQYPINGSPSVWKKCYSYKIVSKKPQKLCKNFIICYTIPSLQLCMYNTLTIIV